MNRNATSHRELSWKHRLCRYGSYRFPLDLWSMADLNSNRLSSEFERLSAAELASCHLTFSSPAIRLHSRMNLEKGEVRLKHLTQAADLLLTG